MPTLETENLLLRPLNLNDANRIEELAGEYDVAKTTLNIAHPYPAGCATTFIESVLASEETGKIAMFAINEKETDSLIGLINLNLSPSHKRGELAYWVGKPYWGKGYGTEAASILLSFGFEQLQLNKIFAAAFTSNPGSWRIMEKIGLKYEGTLKQHVARFGEFYDLAFYGLLKDQYLNENAQIIEAKIHS